MTGRVSECQSSKYSSYVCVVHCWCMGICICVLCIIFFCCLSVYVCVSRNIFSVFHTGTVQAQLDRLWLR